MRFVPTQNFHDAGSDYCVGLSYFTRTPELAAKVSEWVNLGLVRTEPMDTPARAAGRGTVS